MSRNYNKDNERFTLQFLIDDKKISTPQGLLSYIENKNWSIKRTNRKSKDGRNMLGIRISPGQVFLVSFDFNCSAFKPQARCSLRYFPDEKVSGESKQEGIWIYGLFASTAASKACYIGQTKRCLTRFRSHLMRTKNGNGSSGLFDWAEENDTQVYVAMLDYTVDISGKSKTAKQATILEGTWLKRAVNFGYTAPMIEKWGRLPFDPGTIKNGWPYKDVSRHSIPLKEAVEATPSIFTFSIPMLVCELKKIKEN